MTNARARAASGSRAAGSSPNATLRAILNGVGEELCAFDRNTKIKLENRKSEPACAATPTSLCAGQFAQLRDGCLYASSRSEPLPHDVGPRMALLRALHRSRAQRIAACGW